MPGRASFISDLAGCVVDNGRYELLQSLGSGAYGAVYRALDRETPKGDAPLECAVKVIPKVGLSEREQENVRREVTLHRSMSNHRHVVTLLRVFEDDEYAFIVMEFVSGGDLFTRIAQGGLFYRNDDLLKHFFIQVLDAVQECHKRCIFHRDLKPENILCTKDGKNIYLADFGLATTHPLSATFGCGSTLYMSPECIGREFGYTPYSTRHNDIWALGVILVNMITARSPWDRATTDDDCFYNFAVNDDFLLDVLPISKGANEIIKRIFDLEPLNRITIPQIRDAILHLDTFFMTDAEIARAPPNVAVAAKFLAAMHCSPKEKAEQEVQVQAHDDARQPNEARDVSSCAGLSEAGTSESDESDGPRTPAVHPVEPPVEVPDLDEEQDLSDPVLLRGSIDGKHILPRPLQVLDDYDVEVV